MEIRLHDDVEEFATFAFPLLAADPVRHTTALTVLDGLRRTGDRAAVLATVHEGSEVCGAAVRTPGWPLIVSALPGRYAAPADAALVAADPGLAGATGPIGEVDAFAAAHVARTRKAVEVVLRLRMFALAALRPPSGVPGAARRAGERDVDLVAAWRLAFDEEAIGRWRAELDPRASALRALRSGQRFLLWEVEGTPVALASVGLPVAGMSRVASVYTPPEHRGRGYGTAVTAAASAGALAAGAREVVLFTDLANPVTNAIYPRIGYRPVHDALELGFR